jgi:transposase InsO family protein
MSCDIAGVSRAGYYKWLKNFNKPEKDHDDYLIVKAIFDKGKRKYGFRTIQMKLLGKKIVMNHKKIIRIMNKYHLSTKIRRVNPYKAITKKSLEHRTFENKLDRQFNQTEPGTVLCTDITYLPFKYRFVYLSVIKDIASREIVGWNLANHLEMDLVLQTIEDMKGRLDLSTFKNIMIHSDQGFHYTNPLYIEKIKGLNMIQSMSRKGNCIDNSPMESFFGHFKDDVDYKSCANFEELCSLIDEYMRYYNQERQQWELKKMTPVEYRNHLLNHA